MQIEALTTWLDKEDGQQKKLKAHEEPSLLSTAISSRVSQMQTAFDKLNKKKKPAPPPPPPSKNVNGSGMLSCSIFHPIRVGGQYMAVSTLMSVMQC